MSQNQPQIDTRVIVVGAGPVGLSIAIELGLRGIPVVLIEQRIRTGAQPRLRTLSRIRRVSATSLDGVARSTRTACKGRMVTLIKVRT